MNLNLYSTPAFLTLQDSNDYIFEHTCCRDFDWDKVCVHFLSFWRSLSGPNIAPGSCDRSGKGGLVVIQGISWRLKFIREGRQQQSATSPRYIRNLALTRHLARRWRVVGMSSGVLVGILGLHKGQIVESASYFNGASQDRLPDDAFLAVFRS